LSDWDIQSQVEGRAKDRIPLELSRYVAQPDLVDRLGPVGYPAESERVAWRPGNPARPDGGEEVSMRIATGTMLGRALILIPAVAGMLWAVGAAAGTVTFSGTVGYAGSHSGDSLYVAVLDTTGVEDVTILAIHAYAVGAPPFSQGYSLDFDNTGVGPLVQVVALLDVDGGGTSSVSGADIFGWYGENPNPLGVSSAASLTDLDFFLPLAEIHGTLTFAPGQTDARVNVTTPITGCLNGGFRPSDPFLTDGSYAIVGVYEGVYCISGEGSTPTGNIVTCYNDPSCSVTTYVDVGIGEIVTGIDLDFAATVPVHRTTWGLVKSRY